MISSNTLYLAPFLLLSLKQACYILVVLCAFEKDYVSKQHPSLLSSQVVRRLCDLIQCLQNTHVICIIVIFCDHLSKREKCASKIHSDSSTSSLKKLSLWAKLLWRTLHLWRVPWQNQLYYITRLLIGRVYEIVIFRLVIRHTHLHRTWQWYELRVKLPKNLCGFRFLENENTDGNHTKTEGTLGNNCGNCQNLASGIKRMQVIE